MNNISKPNEHNSGPTGFFVVTDELPVLMQPVLAKAVGVNNAIFLQRMHELLVDSELVLYGRKWLDLTCKKWLEYLPFWSETTILNIVKSLKSKHILIVEIIKQAGTGWSKLYRIDEERLIRLCRSEQTFIGGVHPVWHYKICHSLSSKEEGSEAADKEVDRYHLRNCNFPLRGLLIKCAHSVRSVSTQETKTWQTLNVRKGIQK